MHGRNSLAIWGVDARVSGETVPFGAKSVNREMGVSDERQIGRGPETD
jgi:hypothetical protein